MSADDLAAKIEEKKAKIKAAEVCQILLKFIGLHPVRRPLFNHMNRNNHRYNIYIYIYICMYIS